MAITYKVRGREVTKAVYDASRRKMGSATAPKPPAKPLPKLVVPPPKPPAQPLRIVPVPRPPTVHRFTEPDASFGMPNFLAELNKDGYALPSRYEVLITPPAGHPDKSYARTVSMRVETIDMPGRALNTSPDTNMYGIAPEIVDGITFAGTIALTIQTSSNLKEREFFQSWQELAWNKETWNIGYYKDYIGLMEIYILDINNVRRYGVKIFDCFPKEVGPVALSYNQATEIIKTPVTMEYKYWVTLKDATNQPALSANINDRGATRVQRQNIPKAISALNDPVESLRESSKNDW